MTNAKQWALVIGAIIVGYVLLPVLTPFFIAGVLAYLGDPLVNHLQRWKIPRVLGVVIVFLLTALLIVGAIVLVIPVIQEQLLVLVHMAPDMLRWLEEQIMRLLSPIVDVESMDFSTLQNLFSSHMPQLSVYTGKVVTAVSQSGMAIVKFFINLLVTIVVAFYLIRDWPRFKEKCDKSLPRPYQKTVKGLLRECDEVLSAFFFGQLLVMLTLAFFYSISLSLLGLNVAVMVGVLAGLISVVPYFGSIVGVVIAMAAALIQFHTGNAVTGVAIIFVLGHLLESMVLTPWLVGDRIGLHPVAVIFAVLAGGMLLGFVGVLIALPVAAVVRVIIRHFYQRYLSSHFYRGQSA